MSIISNTTVLSNFASIQQLDLLRQLFGRLYLSTQVYDEIRLSLEEGYGFYAGIDQFIFPLVEDGWLHLTSLTDEREVQLFSALPSHLHSGEASCLAIARQRGWLLLTDDRAARQEATRQTITRSGSVGCLVLCVERGLITPEQANFYLGQMIEQGYHSPVTDLAPLLKRNV